MANARITLENVRVLPGGFRNFAGRGDQYNRDGDRNFHIGLSEEQAQALLADGLNVKVREARDEGGEDTYILKVAVSWKVKAPRIYTVAGNKQTALSEDLVAILDDTFITYADVVIEASEWEVNGKTGVKAYLSKAYFTIEQDDLDLKYAHLEVGN